MFNGGGQGGGRGPATPHYMLSLRFRDQQAERGYAQSRVQLLIRRVRLWAFVHLVASLSALLFLLVSRKHMRDMLPTDIAHESYLMQAVGMCGMICLMAAVLVSWKLLGSPLATKGVLALEGFTVATMIFSLSMTTFLHPKRSVKLRGYSLLEAFEDGYDSDSGVLLMIELFVACSHLSLPIRWFVMAPLELAALLLYILVVFVVGSEEPRDHIFLNFLLLACLVLAAAWGKRSAELEQRREFLTIISEKALRCQAEFQLSQVVMEAPRKEELRSEGRSELRSEAVTDRSGGIFDPLFEKGVDKSAQLRLVAEKGDSEHWRIPVSEITFVGEAIARGGFGSVQRAIFCGMLVAVKRPRLDMPRGVMVADLCNELRILRHLRHPNIVAAHGAVVLPENEEIYLVLELVDGCNLTNFLHPTRSPPSSLQRYQIMLGTSRALLYMHTRLPQIVHGDLKGDNIMVEVAGSSAVPKVLDFGLSRLINAHSRSLGGTLAWIAPEVLTNGPVRCTADIYSFGHMLAFSATSLLPMRNLTREAVLSALKLRQLPQPTWPTGCAFGASCQCLVHECLRPFPHDRPNIQEVHESILNLSMELALPSEGFLRQVKDLVRLLDAGQALKSPAPARSNLAKLSPLPEEPSTTDETCEAVLPFPELQETSKQAMEASLFKMVAHWNCSGKSGCCCERHSYVQLAKETMQRVCNRPYSCGKVVRPQEMGQCGNCGILLPVGAEECELCGWTYEQSKVAL